MHEPIETISPNAIDFATQAALVAHCHTGMGVTGELGVTVRETQPLYELDDIGWSETAYLEIIEEAEALCAAEMAADDSW